MYLNEDTPLRYVIKINGVVVSIPFTSKLLAEGHIQNLPLEQQPIAEVVPVDDQGRELLLG